MAADKARRARDQCVHGRRGPKQKFVARTTNVCLEVLDGASLYRFRTCGAPPDDA
jgi:hypothetical protein